MIDWRNIAFCSVVLSAVLTLAGCSSTAANPELYSTAPATLSAESETQPVPAPGSAPSTSSLEAFQRGESTATPASSPLKEVYFDFERYDVRADARETLKANEEWLKANPSAVVEIEGHCDERGTNKGCATNLWVGIDRCFFWAYYLNVIIAFREIGGNHARNLGGPRTAKNQAL